MLGGVATRVVTCPRCGAPGSQSARFCASCGISLDPSGSAADVRKTVTAVFCDVTGSTVLARQLDAEALRHVMERYFAAVSTVLARHGGTVEKFVGDAVMAVFGAPVAHEDDALRACRAALEMFGAVGEVAGSVATAHGVHFGVRIGVETGEAVVGDVSRGSTFASGVVVNAAARLEQAAQPGECLIGPECYRLVRAVAVVEGRPGLVVKGIDEPIDAYRLLGVGEPGNAQATPAALVGRARELALLRQAFDRAASDRTCQLATVLGPAGIGKSRLAAEFLTSLGTEATVLRGRCVSYGEGVTYRPLVEAVRQAAHLSGAESEQQARAALAALLGDGPDASEVVKRVAALAGLGGAPGSPEDSAWAVRRLLEALSAARPAVLVVDDLHWAEPGLVDLLQGICDWPMHAPILVAVFARPEFLDEHPEWVAARVNGVTALLQPLGDDEVEALTTGLLGGLLPKEAADQVTASAGGNPLFVEQLLAMLVEEGVLVREGTQWLLRGEVTALQIPPTIGALLTARLDRLSTGERAALGPAAVIGQVFYRAALVELSSSTADQVSTDLRSLARKGLIQQASSDLPGQDALRFGHVLIRDAAYGALPKASRADLHERFARWLDKHHEGQAVNDLVGSHQESAYHLRAQLGALDEATLRLGQEAADRLTAAGRLLLVVDNPAAVGLLTRALALRSADGPERWSIQSDLIDPLLSQLKLRQAAEIAEDIRATAIPAGALQWATRGRLEAARVRQMTAPEGATEILRREAEQAILVFDKLGDDVGLGFSHQALADVGMMSGDLAAFAKEAQLAADHLARAGREQQAQVARLGALSPMINGAHPASLALIEARRQVTAMDGRRMRMLGLGGVYILAELLGRREEAQRAREQAESLLTELRSPDATAALSWQMGSAALACGRAAEAAELLAHACAVHEAAGATGFLSTTAGYHAHALLLTGDHPEARRQVDRALETGSTDDVLTQGLARSALAWLAAADGEEPATVRRHMSAGLAALEPTEMILDLAVVHAACAEAARLLGDDTAARQHRQRAIDLYDTKENIVGAAVQRALLVGEAE